MKIKKLFINKNTLLKGPLLIKNKVFGNILYRQIAGALARRIVNYALEGREIKQGDESGFIKFGSRLDIFLPLKTKVNVRSVDPAKKKHIIRPPWKIYF